MPLQCALWIWASPSVRRWFVDATRTEAGFFLVGGLAAVWLSLGPAPEVLGRPLDVAAPFLVLWDHVPGFDGLRVPARFAMVATVMFCGLGGLGAGWDFFAILRLVIGLIFPALLTYAGWRTAKARSMESATGLLYIDLGAVATGTILAAGLFFGAGILV